MRDEKRVTQNVAIGLDGRKHRRNRYMVDNSDFLIAYAWHPGNARELVEYAQRRERRGLLRVNVLGQA